MTEQLEKAQLVVIGGGPGGYAAFFRIAGLLLIMLSTIHGDCNIPWL